MGLGPLAERCASLYDLKVTRRIARDPAPAASDAMDDTENNDRSVVTDSWDGERSIRHATVNTGVWGGAFGSVLSVDAIVETG